MIPPPQKFLTKLAIVLHVLARILKANITCTSIAFNTDLTLVVLPAHDRFSAFYPVNLFLTLSIMNSKYLNFFPF